MTAPRDNRIVKNDPIMFPNLWADQSLTVSSIKFPSGTLSTYLRTSPSCSFTGQRTFTAPVNFTQVGNLVNMLFTIPSGNTSAGSSIVGTISAGGIPPDIGVIASGYATLLENTTPIPVSITFTGTTITLQKLGNGTLTSFGSAILSGTCSITYSIGN